MENKMSVRNSTLIEFLCDKNHRLLDVLQDLMGFEIPDQTRVRFLQAGLPVNPLTLTHACVVINGDAYIVIEDPAVLDTYQIQYSYEEICNYYGEMLKRDEVEWNTITPIILSTSGMIRLPEDLCGFKPFIPAIGLIGADLEEKEFACPCPNVPACSNGNDDNTVDSMNSDECCANDHDDGWLDEDYDPVIEYLANKRDYDDALIIGSISKHYTPKEQKEYIRDLHPEMEEDVLDDMLLPLPGVFVARHKESLWEYRIFDVTSTDGHEEHDCDGNCAVCPAYHNENYALVVSTILHNYSYGVHIVERVRAMSNAVYQEQADAILSAYMNEDCDDEFRDFLRQPGNLKHLKDELALFNYVINQRETAIYSALHEVKKSIDSLHNLC